MGGRESAELEAEASGGKRLLRAIFGVAVGLFDWLERRWTGHRSARAVGTLLSVVFLAALLVIELNREGLLPGRLRGWLPTNHFHAVDLALVLLLLFEILVLVFTLARSVSSSVGKQFEIVSLILVRQSFEHFTAFEEPVTWDQVRGSIVDMLAVASAALLIFVVLGFYYRLQKHRPITSDLVDQWSFVAVKKMIALLLLIGFIWIGVSDLQRWFAGLPVYPFFDTFYTLLIFSDVLMVLVSLRYSSTYRVVFRNSGFAVATVFLRLSLTAPARLRAVLAVGAALFGLGLTAAYNAFAGDLASRESGRASQPTLERPSDHGQASLG